MAIAARLSEDPRVTSIKWESDGPGFGGWSALEVSADGMDFVAVADSGSITTGQFLRTNGVLTGVQSKRQRWVLGPDGEPNPQLYRDSEGLAQATNGDIFISYEGYHRVARHPGWRGNEIRLPRSADFEQQQFNASFEALAIDESGHLFTMPERSGAKDRPFPVFEFDGAHWSQPYALNRDGSWLVVGADFGPDGRLYILERRFLGIGFASQIRRFDVGEGSGVVNGTVLYRSKMGQHGNLEGMAIWADDTGRLRATMVSDNNHKSFQRTQFVEVLLDG